MTAPNDSTIAQMSGALNWLKIAAAPLDHGDPIRDKIENAIWHVQYIIDELNHLRNNL